MTLNNNLNNLHVYAYVSTYELPKLKKKKSYYQDVRFPSDFNDQTIEKGMKTQMEDME